MGLFEAIFGKPKVQSAGQKFWELLDGYTPSFTSWGGELYESEIVRAAVHATANHASKLDVKIIGSAKPELQTRLRQGPNSWQTWGQFLYRLSTILDMQNTAFVVPVLEGVDADGKDKVVGIFPVLPSNCEVKQYAGQPFLVYTFQNGKTASVEMKKCAILTKFQYKNDLFGEDNRALNPTMDLVNIQNQGIKEAVKNSASFRFMARLSNFAKSEDLKKSGTTLARKIYRARAAASCSFPRPMITSSSSRARLSWPALRRWSASVPAFLTTSVSMKRSSKTRHTVMHGTLSMKAASSRFRSNSATLSAGCFSLKTSWPGEQKSWPRPTACST